MACPKKLLFADELSEEHPVRSADTCLWMFYVMPAVDAVLQMSVYLI